VKNVIGRLPPPDPFWAELGRRVVRERGFIAFTVLAFAIAWAFLLVNANYRDLCQFAKLSRQNQIESAVDQAQTLIGFAVMDMRERGESEAAILRVRKVSGPAFIKRIRDNQERRLPPVSDFCKV
jgi:hypothetical protein